MSSVDMAEAKISKFHKLLFNLPDLDNVLMHKLGHEKNKRALDETRAVLLFLSFTDQQSDMVLSS
jgi:hypothetical protein